MQWKRLVYYWQQNKSWIHNFLCSSSQFSKSIDSALFLNVTNCHLFLASRHWLQSAHFEQRVSEWWRERKWCLSSSILFDFLWKCQLNRQMDMGIPKGEWKLISWEIYMVIFSEKWLNGIFDIHNAVLVEISLKNLLLSSIFWSRYWRPNHHTILVD